MPKVMVLGGGAFGRSSGHEGCHDLMRLIALLKQQQQQKTLESFLAPFHHVRTQ